MQYFQVALGNCREDVDSSVEVDLINSEYNSLKIHGTNVPDELWDLTLPYGKNKLLETLVRFYDFNPL